MHQYACYHKSWDDRIIIEADTSEDAALKYANHKEVALGEVVAMYIKTISKKENHGTESKKARGR